MIDGQTTVLTVPGVSWGGELELQTKVREDFKIMENAPTGCKWLLLLSHLRHYAKWALGREEAPEYFFRRTAITSPDCQEFMV